MTELREQFYMDPWPGRWAALANVVLASPDPATREILDQAARERELDVLVGVVLEKLGNFTGLPVILAGGLTSSRSFCEVVTGYLSASRPSSTVSVLSEPPVTGAVRLAALAATGISCPVLS